MLLETMRQIKDHEFNVIWATEKTWLPHELVKRGLFDSGNQIKKNRPDLWRNITPNGDEFQVANLHIEVWLV